MQPAAPGGGHGPLPHHDPLGTPAEAPAAAAAVQQFLVDEARTYLTGGSAALPDYADRSGTTPRAAAFKLLARPSAFLSEYQPDLFRYLDEFPRAPAAGSESFLYWSREKFGLKPTISISHSVLQRRDGAVVFGSKQVFASHYFESSLGMALFIPVEGAAYGDVTYLNRSRVDTLRGLLAPLARVVAARRARRPRADADRCEAETGTARMTWLPPGGRKDDR